MSARSRAGLILVLSVACAVLLIAAPVAILFSGGSGSGAEREPDGVAEAVRLGRGRAVERCLEREP